MGCVAYLQSDIFESSNVVDSIIDFTKCNRKLRKKQNKTNLHPELMVKHHANYAKYYGA